MGKKLALIQVIQKEEASQRAVSPLGLAYLVSYLRQENPELEVKLCNTVEDVLAFSPAVVGISAVTENIPLAVKLAGEIKKQSNPLLVLGGAHISGLPESLPLEFELGVRGEGEITFSELLKTLFTEGFAPKILAEIPGLVFREGEKLRMTPRRPAITPLSRLPFPAREIYGWHRFMYMMTSRGCPYRCVYCSPKVVWGRYRFFPADYVIREIKSIMANSPRHYIHFFDDLFIGSIRRLKELVKSLKTEKLDREMFFGGHIRADLMTEEVGKLLKEMNFIAGAFGAESASPRILEFLKAGTATAEQNQKAVDLCYKLGIELNVSFVLGTPGEKPEDLDATLNFIKKNQKKISAMEIFLLLPYPGTQLWDYALKKGLVSLQMDWQRFGTKAFFFEQKLSEDFLYLNPEAMPRREFLKYAKLFQELDGRINEKNKDLFQRLDSF